MHIPVQRLKEWIIKPHHAGLKLYPHMVQEMPFEWVAFSSTAPPYVIR